MTDGNFVMTQVSDPGALDPQLSIVAGVFEMTGYAYDSIVGLSPEGEILPQLAASWTQDGLKATFDIKDGITCSDGSTMSAQTIADNINWLQDPGNASPYLGTFLPVGITASVQGSTLTFDMLAPAPFLLSSLANVPIVCDAGLNNREQMLTGTSGSGPYELSEAVANDHYVYTRRDGYTWGPGGATTATEGLPKTITVKIVPNESTAVNLILSKDVNLVTTVGADADRAEDAGLPSVTVPANLGFTWYNQAQGHPTSDPAIRKALTQAVNLDDLATVITSNKGGRSTALAVVPPASCSYDSITGKLPTFDVAAAQATMKDAGYTLDTQGMFAKDGEVVKIAFLYDSVLGDAGQAAAELAISQWKAAGFSIEPQSVDTARLEEVLFGTGAWDIVWEPISVNSPDQMVAFLSGPSPAEGGGNLGSIANAAYNAGVEEAMGQTGAEACSAFQKAESALFESTDLVVWAVQNNKIYYSNSEYAYNGRTQVTSLRLLAQ